MKILELCLSTGVGGLELYAVRTAKQLLQRGLACVAVVADGTMTAQRMMEEGVETIPFAAGNRFLPLVAAWRLAQIIDRHQIDVIHLHWGKDLSLAALGKRFAKRPVKLVYTRQMLLTRFKHDFYHRFLYRQVDLFLTITQDLCEQARRFLPIPCEAIATLYYGVDEPPHFDEQQRQALRRELSIGKQQFAVGMIGRIEAIKGQHLLVKAIEQLRQKQVPVQAVIIGPAMDTDYADKLRQQVRDSGLEGAVSFYGSHRNPIEIMAAFDVVVLATRKETFGLVLIEAMRNGVAVVGTRAGGVPEIIDDGETGLMFEPDNADDLASKLLDLYQNEGRRKAAALAGKIKADTLFSQQRHYDKLIEHMSALSKI